MDKTLEVITHTRSNRYERLKMASIVSQHVAIHNTPNPFFPTQDIRMQDLADRIINEAKEVKRTTLGQLMYNFEVEVGNDYLKVWHIKISTRERNELISEVFFKKEVNHE